jgi:GNAT superfamily N-acetyltransferase
MITILDWSSSPSSLDRVRAFAERIDSDSFRYFKTRKVEDALLTHHVTLLYTINDEDVGYAHIDYDMKSARYYLGVCVLEKWQGRGIGKKLIQTLLKQYQGDIWLTVDRTNTVAIRIYEKFDFVRVADTESYYVYYRKTPLTLPVSLGEAIDKLTILDIKLRKIFDKEKKDCIQKEYSALMPYLQSTIFSQPHLYRWLVYVNTEIWDLQDGVRDGVQTTSSNTLLTQILDLNDMRFRIKQRINRLGNSQFHEQKGYAKKVGLFVGHLGLGDMLNMHGAIRYAALDVDTLFVVSKQKYASTTRAMFADDPSIVVVECENDDKDVPMLLYASYIEEEQITKRFLSGLWARKPITSSGIPFSFYDHLEMKYEVRKKFFHIPNGPKLPVPENPYIFLHSTASNVATSRIEKTWNIDEVFTIDPNVNQYAVGHRWHSLAEQYVNKPFLEYVDVLRKATEIHVLDSSFYCLACLLDLDAAKKLCYDRDTGAPSTIYHFQ